MYLFYYVNIYGCFEPYLKSKEHIKNCSDRAINKNLPSG